MITGNLPENQSLKNKNTGKTKQPVWQTLLAEAIRDPAELLQALQLDPAVLQQRPFNPHHFPLRVPWGFVKKMQPGDWDDPLLQQVLPLAAEQRHHSGFLHDPVQDLHAVHSKGLLQKYQGRALLITTGACAIHCRYCFRQHFPYSDNQASQNEWQNIINTLNADNTINEVILSGGDPLALADRRLEQLCKHITAIPHIRTLRLHTRLPLVLPERIDTHFLRWFTPLAIQKVVVIHANHANELCNKTHTALQHLQQAGCMLLNQSVLLKGVNDSATALITLSQKLATSQVLPYYLHLLDRVQGAAHFEVDEQHALQLMQALRDQLPGYLVPRLVREISGKRSKTPVN